MIQVPLDGAVREFDGHLTRYLQARNKPDQLTTVDRTPTILDRSCSRVLAR
jgi:hypothetical protein